MSLPLFLPFALVQTGSLDLPAVPASAWAEVAWYGAGTLGLGADVTFDGQSPVQLTDLRFYVYDVHLIDADGQPHALELIADDTWQRDGLALLDRAVAAARPVAVAVPTTPRPSSRSWSSRSADRRRPRRTRRGTTRPIDQ